MRSEHDTTRIVRSWLEGGSTVVPDRVLDAVLSQLPSTPQRRSPWSPQRFLRMKFVVPMAGAAVVLVAVAFAWVNFGPSSDTVVGPPAPSPTPTPSPSPTPIAGAFSGLSQPGLYRLSDGAGIPLVISLPAGWTSLDGWGVTKDYGTTEEEAGAGFAIWAIENRYVDACTDHTLLDPPPGPGIDALIEALSSQPGIEAGPPTEVTIDGYTGTSIELTVTADIDSCPGERGTPGFWLWGDTSGYRYVQGNNEMNRIYVLDVDGERYTFFARFPARTTTADRAELEAIINSIDIEP